MINRLLFYALCGAFIFGMTGCASDCEYPPINVASITTIADDPTMAKIIDGNKSKTCDLKITKNSNGTVTYRCDRNDNCTINGPVICKLTLTGQKNGDILATCDECK